MRQQYHCLDNGFIDYIIISTFVFTFFDSRNMVVHSAIDTWWYTMLSAHGLGSILCYAEVKLVVRLDTSQCCVYCVCSVLASHSMFRHAFSVGSNASSKRQRIECVHSALSDFTTCCSYWQKWSDRTHIVEFEEELKHVCMCASATSPVCRNAARCCV